VGKERERKGGGPPVASSTIAFCSVCHDKRGGRGEAHFPFSHLRPPGLISRLPQTYITREKRKKGERKGENTSIRRGIALLREWTCSFSRVRIREEKGKRKEKKTMRIDDECGTA